MKIKNVSTSFILSVLFFTSCDITKKEGKNPDGSDSLIAQNTIETEKVEEKLPTITGFVSSDKGFSTFVAALQSTELDKVLDTEKGYTIFAPINTAFDGFSEGVVEKLLKPENKQQLTNILNYHIIPSIITKEDIKIAINEGRGSVPLRTLGGKKLTATMKGNSIFLIDEMGNGGKLITTDVEAANGYINTIDRVMQPKK
ncbi:fasciclin domain-containing protein [Aquimarina gracilis]|uniref:Fasciclin domain-containing protein n=1 Tax=Aquimarina gracilis TaxID=874422 RepID=A0ABU5ZS60_9FLAO|nr:fasciclin domain-containing protein [Aquimarina gracilis]MEB3344909.1 fasciclin domain-containing protein [Aquimarina gracilis]